MRAYTRTVEPGVVTAAEAAQFLGCHPKTVRKLCKTGELHAIKLGSEWRIPAEALEEFLHTGHGDSIAQR